MKGFLKKDDYRLRFAPPKKNVKVDILVIGGGLEGITTAFLAAEKGFNGGTLFYRVGTNVFYAGLSDTELKNG